MGGTVAVVVGVGDGFAMGEGVGVAGGWPGEPDSLSLPAALFISTAGAVARSARSLVLSKSTKTSKNEGAALPTKCSGTVISLKGATRSTGISSRGASGCTLIKPGMASVFTGAPVLSATLMPGV